MSRTLILFALLLSSLIAQDFSGTWKLASQSTVTGTLPEGAAAMLEIEHTASRIRCTAVSAAGARVSYEFTLDGKESKSKAGESSLSSIAKWEGSALLINTIVNGPAGNYTQMDRWRISPDRARLTIGREIPRRTGSVEVRLVYQRQGRPAAPSLVPKPVPAPAPRAEAAPPPEAPKQPEPAPKPVPARYTVEAGTHIPLTLINSVSTKQSREGDRLYLTTSFPVLAGGRVVIPPGSYVEGTLTFVKRPGRIHGRGELYLRFDSLTLPTGVTRDFRSRAGALDGDASGKLDREEGNIHGEGGKGTDARTIGEAAATGASAGAIAGSVAGHPGLGVGTGAAAGVAAGVAAVLLSRGPDILLARGSTIEMILDRPLIYTEEDLSPSWRRVQ